MTNTTIFALAINSRGDIFAGTNGGGVFRHVESTTAVEEISTRIPSSFALEQNYPNPFNPETEIHFQLPAARQVLVRIFNTLGQEIRTLTEIHYDAGFHSVRWDGKDRNGSPVSSGVYLYQIQAGEFSQVRKMSLIR